MLKKNIEQDFPKIFDIFEKIFTKTQCSFQSNTIPRVWMKLFDLNISNYTKTYLVISTAFLVPYSEFCFGGNKFYLLPRRQQCIWGHVTKKQMKSQEANINLA